MIVSVTARFGLFVRYGLVSATFVVAMFLGAVAAMAAPYADYVIDARTGEVLHSDNADSRLHPASLTKMMTLYIVFEAVERGEISLDTMVTISGHAASEPPSKLGLKPGQKIALRYLIRAAAIKSANDAATALGEAIEGSEAKFARRMNRTAKALGMTRTTFKNAHGLTEEGHLSTARDMTMLGRHLFYDFPQYYHLFSRRTADAGVREVTHTNSRFLASYEGADGIKTGYTVAAGFNLVASAQRGKKHVIATVFGGRSTAARNERVTELMDLGFGLAPNRAKIAKPAAPDYASLDAAVPNGEPSDDPRASGKKVRFSGAILKSPRPRPRPAAPTPELLAAIQMDIDAVLAEVQDNDDADAVVVPLADLAEDQVVEVAQAPAEPEGPVMLQTTAPQPETLVLAEAAPADAVAVTVAMVPADTPAIDDSGLPPAASLRPKARPQSVIDLALAATTPEVAIPAEVAVAEVAMDDLTAAEPLPEVVVAVAEPVVEAPSPQPAVMQIAAASEAPPARPAFILAMATEVEPVVAAADPAPVDASAPVVVAPVHTIVASVSSPPTRPDVSGAEIILAAAQPIDPDAPEQEVVTRISTSGGRLHAISLGRFPSRYEAERVLMKTALSEIDTLSEALRTVMPKRGAFDATFAGMTEETAELACRRLSARGTECTVLQP